MPNRGPDMSPRDMRLLAASDKASGAVRSELLVGDFCGSLGCCRLMTPAATVAYASQPSVGPGYRLLWEASSPVVTRASGVSPNRCPGAGRRLAGSDGQSELERSSAFLLLTWSCRESREFRASPPAPLGGSSAEALVALALVAARAFRSLLVSLLCHWSVGGFRRRGLLN
jgi:hypothetical protein